MSESEKCGGRIHYQVSWRPIECEFVVFIFQSIIHNRFSCSLCVADCLFCMIVLPFNAFRFIQGTWTHGDFLCRLVPFMQYGNVGVSLLCIAMITINRYVSQRHIFSHSQIFSIILIFNSHLFSYFIFLFVNFVDETNVEQKKKYCTMHWDSNIFLFFVPIWYRYVMIAHHSSYARIYKRHWIAAMIAFCWLFAYGMQLPTLFTVWGLFQFIYFYSSSSSLPPSQSLRFRMISMIDGRWQWRQHLLLPNTDCMFSSFWFLGAFGYDKNLGTCSILPDANGRSSKAALFIIAFVIPCMIIVGCYARIFWVVHE